MRIKTFEAATMQEALMLAKNEMGEDAVVLNTKHVKAGGILGIGGGNRVELMAAVDENAARPPVAAPQAVVQLMGSIPQPEVAFPSISMPVVEAQMPQGVMIPQLTAPVEETPATTSFTARLYNQVAPSVRESDPELAALRAELKDLSTIVQKLIGGQSPAAVEQVKPLLIRLGVDEDLARNLLSDCLGIEDPAELAMRLAARMQSFAVPPQIDQRQVIALVGPTGVGKTTTLAKLAAKFSLEQGKKVALVTADTYRIGAVEQLRTYARIMGVPLEIALSPEEVAAGVEKHADKDVVLIDTVGRSQRNGEHIKELKSFVDAANPTQTHLVISASLSSAIQREVLESFALLSPTNLLITKLDESPDRGCLVNLPLTSGLGISCVTAGQNVPQDIDMADAGRLARYLVEVA